MKYFVEQDKDDKSLKFILFSLFLPIIIWKGGNSIVVKDSKGKSFSTNKRYWNVSFTGKVSNYLPTYTKAFLNYNSAVKYAIKKFDKALNDLKKSISEIQEIPTSDFRI